MPGGYGKKSASFEASDAVSCWLGWSTFPFGAVARMITDYMIGDKDDLLIDPLILKRGTQQASFRLCKRPVALDGGQ